MKKILLTTIIIFIFFSGIFPLVQQIPRAVAQETNTELTSGQRFDQKRIKDQEEKIKTETDPTKKAEMETELVRLKKIESDKNKDLANAAATRVQAEKGTCDSLIPIYCALVAFGEWAMSLIAVIPIAITSFFVYVSGSILDIVVSDLVVDFPKYFNAADSGILETWSTLRDLANIFFIFGLLTIAISTILGTGYGYRKHLPTIIIVALFINFSLFFTKFIIDISNIFALQFYNGIAGLGNGASISSVFMNQLGVVSLHDTGSVLESLRDLASKDGGIGLIFTYSIFTSIFFMITAFVFMFTAIMLVIRAVGFILLVILSPLAFVAMALPKTQYLAKDWWTNLFKYALFAPILFMLLWVTITIMQSITESVSLQNGFLDVFSGDSGKRAGAAGLMVNFLILITLMLASVIISNKLSLAGGKQAVKLAGKTTFGTLGALGRNLPGRGFSKLSQYERFKNTVETAGKTGATRLDKIKGFGARMAIRGTQYGAKASYDLRAAPGIKDTAKTFGIGDLGKPQKGGYDAILKKQTKAIDAFKKSLKTDTTNEENEKATLTEELNLTQEQIDTIKKEKETADIKLKTAKVQHENAKRAYGKDSFKALSKERGAKDIGKTVNQLTTKVDKISEIETKLKDVNAKIANAKETDKERTRAYARTLATEKTFSTLFMKVPRKNKEAAVMVREVKSKEERHAEMGRELAEEKLKEKESKEPKEDKEESKPKDK